MGPETIAIISAGLKLGLECFEQARRLSTDGIKIPGIEEFEAGTKELRELPDLTPKKEDVTE